MNYFIKGKNISYDSQNNIFKLGTFILENPQFFSILCDILITAKGRRRERMVHKIIQTHIEKNSIQDDELLTEFLDLLSKFFREDDKNNGNSRGKVVEYIISKIGPLSFESPDIILKECYVLDENDNRVGGEKNFDIGFYCSYNCISELSAELIESKVDLNNFVLKEPFNRVNPELDDDAIEKLKYMKNINQVLNHSKHLVVALATVRYDVSLSEFLLEREGYDSIKVYNYNHLKYAINMR